MSKMSAETAMNEHYVWTNLDVCKTLSAALRHINKSISDLGQTVEP